MEDEAPSRLALGFALGVKGLGGVFSIRLKTSSSLGVSAMAILTLDADKLTRTVQINNEAKYYEALGAFIHEFSVVEFAIHGLLARRAGVDANTANALFSGITVDKAPDFVRRLAEARTGSREVEPELESAFSQLTIINKARNEIIHYGAHVKNGDARYVSTRSKAVTLKKSTLRAVSPEILGQMRLDAIKLHITFSVFGQTAEEALRDVFAPDLAKPWQYRPHQPDRQDQEGTGAKAPRKSKRHRRGASPESR